MRGLGKGVLNMNAVELFKDSAQAERSQVFAQAAVPCFKVYGPGSSVSRIVKVLALTRLNIFWFLTFLLIAETTLSRSRSTLKFCLALSMISVIWRGFWAASSTSYTILICDIPFLRGLNLGCSTL